MYLVKVQARFYKESYHDFVLYEGRDGDKDSTTRKNWEDKFFRVRVKAKSDKQAKFLVYRFYDRQPSLIKMRIVEVSPFIRGYKFDESL